MAQTERLAQLLENLVLYFDLEELRTLCFDLGLDYDELRGEVKSSKACDLITVMLIPEQHSSAKIDDLLTPAGWAAQSRDQTDLGVAHGLFCSESIK